MSRRCLAVCWTTTLLSLFAFQPCGSARELLYGCLSKPACGKVCKLVYEKKKLTAFGYGYKCDAICVPGPSERGCKYCCVKCCDGPPCDPCKCGCQDAPAKIEFTWRKWLACGCAKPREIKLLTKYQAEKEICWYHWEVVDSGCCGCGGCGCGSGCCQDHCCAENGDGASGSACQCVYKPAPADAKLGDVFELSTSEQTELAAAGVLEQPDTVAARTNASALK